MAKTRSDEDKDVNIDEDKNREIDIDEDIKNTRDSMAKACNGNYNSIKVDVEDIADVDIKNNRVSEVDGDDNYKDLKIEEGLITNTFAMKHE